MALPRLRKLRVLRTRKRNPKRKNPRRKKRTRMRTTPSSVSLKKSTRSMKSTSSERNAPRCTTRNKTYWCLSTTWKFRESA